MNGAASPRIVVCRITATEITAITIPNTYNPKTNRSAFTLVYCDATAPQTAAKIGAFAPHVKNGITRLVITRSFSSASVRVLIAAGTEHPNPMIIGMNARPDNPNFRNALSSMNATRAMYPESSNIEISKNKNKICGTNDNTPESPAQIPSFTSPCAHAAAPTFSSPVAIPPPIWSHTNPVRLNNIAPGVDIPAEL